VALGFVRTRWGANRRESLESQGAVGVGARRGAGFDDRFTIL
jgi:hypothetical protein